MEDKDTANTAGILSIGPPKLGWSLANKINGKDAFCASSGVSVADFKRLKKNISV